ncbi:MAG: DUF4268 domain-containing protein [Desulfovibrio sp.]|nr:DUF4268 domain-containing protein [Desulfovibrio sp.]
MDAVVSVPETRMLLKNFNKDVVLDLSSPEKEWAAGMFPLNILYDGYAREKWGNGYKKLYGFADEAVDRYSAFLEEVLAPALEYKLPVITLSKETPKEAVCQVFEHVNTGGVSLTVFELVTATFASGNFDLRQDWFEHVRSAVRGEGEELATDVMKAVDEKDFLTAVTLYASHERRLLEGRETGSSCKRKDVLELSLADYQKYKNAVIDGFRMAREFLLDEGVYLLKDLPYVSQLVPLAAVCAAAGRKLLADPKAQEELRRWYWCGVFGEMYGGMTDTVFANDMDDVPRAMKAAAGGLPPVPIRTAGAAFFSAVRLLSMKSKNSAAYKGVAALVWNPRGTQDSGRDFLSGIRMDRGRAVAKKPDIHHIFPKKWCLESGDEYARANMDSIVNKTPLEPETNRLIGGDAPSVYERKLEKASGKDAAVIRGRIESHLVDWGAFMSNDFKTHFVFRAKKLLNLIEDAMGREVADRASAQTVERFGASLADPDRPSPPVLPAPKPAPAAPLPAKLFSAVKDCVLAFGGVEVRESEERPWYCSFFAGKGRFLAAVRQRDRVKLRVYVKDGELDDPQGLTALGNRDGERVLFVQDEAELEAAMPLVRQSYDAAVKDSARDEEALFGNASPDVRGAWDALKSRVLALDGAGLSFREGYPFFAASGRLFLAAGPRKTGLKLYLGVPKGEMDDPDGRAVLLKNPSRGVGDYKVFAKDAADVDALMPLIWQAFGEDPAFPKDVPAATLYAEFKKRVLAFGRVQIEVFTHYIFLSVDGKLFAAVNRFEQKKLDVFLRMEKKNLDDPAGLSEDVSEECEPGECRICASSATDVDEILPLVRQSFEAAQKRRESFRALTAFLPRLQVADFGTEEGRNLAGELHGAVYKYAIAHQNKPFFNYPEALKKAGVWKDNPEDNPNMCDPSLLASLDGTAVMAMVWGVASHDRISEGLFDSRVESGCMAKWLARLEEIDKAGDEDDSGPAPGIQLRFWTAFCRHASGKPEMTAAFSIRKPHPQSFYDLAAGVSGLVVSFYFPIRKNCVQASVYFCGRKDLFAEFRRHEEEIVGELDAGEVFWREARKDCRFYVERDVDHAKESSWAETFDWLCTMSLRLKEIALKYGNPPRQTGAEAVAPSPAPLMETILLGLAVGDATGVPFEFMKRGTFEAKPMQGGGGHGQPAGTWSDDTALALAFADALLPGGFNAEKAGRNFQDWLYKGKFTARGNVFDVGGATRESIGRMKHGVPPEQAGGAGEYDNGNGSLMRIAPIVPALLDVRAPEARYEAVRRASSLTHAHPLACACCFVFAEYLRLLSLGWDRNTGYRRLCADFADGFPFIDSDVLAKLGRVLDGGLPYVPKPEIQSGGFVVDTLEAALWCLLNSESYEETVLKASGLGRDADTTACVAGAAAAVFGGMESSAADGV